jgi:predicted SprT family Zn-dependent metalloprotease
MTPALSHNDINALLGITTPAQERDVANKIDELLAFAEQRYANVTNKSLSTPAVNFNLKGQVAGRANAHEIDLNVELLNNPDLYDEMLNVTLPHEVAHVVVCQLWPYAKGHGNEWRAVMRDFGLPPNRTHDMPTTPARVHPRPHHYTCPWRYRVQANQ